MGTATTINLLTKDRRYIGGAILTGLQTSMDGLTQATSLLPKIKIVPSKLKVGTSTLDQLQLNFHFYRAGLESLIKELAQQGFGTSEPYMIIGSGGYADKFTHEKLFDKVHPDLKLLGIYQVALARF